MCCVFTCVCILPFVFNVPCVIKVCKCVVVFNLHLCLNCMNMQCVFNVPCVVKVYKCAVSVKSGGMCRVCFKCYMCV